MMHLSVLIVPCMTARCGLAGHIGWQYFESDYRESAARDQPHRSKTLLPLSEQSSVHTHAGRTAPARIGVPELLKALPHSWSSD